jgi:hypothetical protein
VLYVASYYVSGGNYAFTAQGLASDVSALHLTAPGSASVGGNGLFVYGVGGGFPTGTYQAANYWVDVRFVPASPTSETIFGDVLPDHPVAADVASVELGVKFKSAVPGAISAIRFFRGAANGAGYSAHLWSADGRPLASGNVVEGQCTVPCWQEVQLVPAAPIAAGVVYVASYFAGNGRYPYQYEGMTTGFQVGDLTALDNASANGNGVFRYSATSGFPSQSYRATNYFVDVRFTPSP